MTDNVTFYSVAYATLPPEPMETLAEGVDGVRHRRDGAAHVYEWADRTMRCTAMPEAEMAGHLEGFQGFVRAHATPAAAPALIERVRATRLVVGVVIEPGHDAISQELVGRMLGGLEPMVVLPHGVFDADGTALITFGATEPKATSAPPASAPAPRDESHLAPEALQRRQRSIAQLRAEGVPVLETLPVIETEAEAKVRPIEEIVERAIALSFVAVRGEGLELDRTLELVDEWSAQLTPAEEAFLALEHPTDHQRVQFVWRYEALGVLFWALELDFELGRPDHIVDAGEVIGLLRSMGPSAFRSWSRRRAVGELLDAADLIYRYHWAVVDARLRFEPPPADLDRGVVYERHYALNWLLGYLDQSWDDVSTDT